ncbi:MAG: DUF4296 domain-containing protein [Crocinitomicaceae bacterium]|nr:DUF4296 domain-containing protein [Crocinitomicaceae bacterium]
MRIRLYISSALLVLASCSADQEELDRAVPEELLPEPTLMNVIIDLQILESQYQFRYQRPEVYKKALDSASYFVYEKHGTTREQFIESYDYYATDIDLMFLIYEAALDSVNRLATSQDQQP